MNGEWRKLGYSKTFWVFLLGATALLSACGDKPLPAAAPAAAKPQYSGALVTFAPGSPQLASLGMAPVVAMGNVGIDLTARLVWDENRTVRIYAPFAGRVLRIAAQACACAGVGAAKLRLNQARTAGWK